MDEEGNVQAGSLNDLYNAVGLTPPVAETPPVETPPVETPKETPPQETPPVETPPENTVTPPEVPETPPVEEPKETIFEINEINQRFETEFKDEGEFRLALDSLKRIEELEAKANELDNLKEENIILKENLDPMKYFDSEDEFRAALFKKQFPDKDATTAYQLFSADLDSLEHKDIIAYDMMLNTPGITKADADLIVADKYGIEDGEIDPLGATKMKVDAAAAKRGIASLKSQVTLPDKVDVDSLASQQKELLAQKKELLSKGWKDIGKEVERTLSDLKVSGKDAEGEEWSFTYSMAKDFPSDVTQEMADYMASTGTELTKEAVQQMGAAMQREYFYQNKDKILASFREDILAKAEETRLKKQHHPGTPEPGAPPVTDPHKETSNNILSAMENTGFRPRKF
jgi:hypothetical protein